MMPLRGRGRGRSGVSGDTSGLDRGVFENAGAFGRGYAGARASAR